MTYRSILKKKQQKTKTTAPLCPDIFHFSWFLSPHPLSKKKRKKRNLFIFTFRTRNGEGFPAFQRLMLYSMAWSVLQKCRLFSSFFLEKFASLFSLVKFIPMFLTKIVIFISYRLIFILDLLIFIRCF